METDKLIARLKEAQRIQSNSDGNEIHKFLLEINDFKISHRQLLVTGSQLLQGFLQLWNPAKRSDMPFLGNICIGFTQFVIKQLLVTTVDEDASKAMKVLSFALINAFKMITDINLLIPMLDISGICFCGTFSLGSPDIRGKCTAHHLQLVGQVVSQYRTIAGDRSNPLNDIAIDRIYHFLQTTFTDNCFLSISQSSLLLEDRQKVISFALDAAVHFEFSVASPSGKSAMTSILNSYVVTQISYSKILEQVGRQIATNVRTMKSSENLEKSLLHSISFIANIANFLLSSSRLNGFDLSSEFNLTVMDFFLEISHAISKVKCEAIHFNSIVSILVKVWSYFKERIASEINTNHHRNDSCFLQCLEGLVNAEDLYCRHLQKEDKKSESRIISLLQSIDVEKIGNAFVVFSSREIHNSQEIEVLLRLPMSLARVELLVVNALQSTKLSLASAKVLPACLKTSLRCLQYLESKQCAEAVVGNATRLAGRMGRCLNTFANEIQLFIEQQNTNKESKSTWSCFALELLLSVADGCCTIFQDESCKSRINLITTVHILSQCLTMIHNNRVSQLGFVWEDTANFMRSGNELTYAAFQQLKREMLTSNFAGLDSVKYVMDAIHGVLHWATSLIITYFAWDNENIPERTCTLSNLQAIVFLISIVFHEVDCCFLEFKNCRTAQEWSALQNLTQNDSKYLEQLIKLCNAAAYSICMDSHDINQLSTSSSLASTATTTIPGVISTIDISHPDAASAIDRLLSGSMSSWLISTMLTQYSIPNRSQSSLGPSMYCYLLSIVEKLIQSESPSISYDKNDMLIMILSMKCCLPDGLSSIQKLSSLLQSAKGIELSDRPRVKFNGAGGQSSGVTPSTTYSMHHLHGFVVLATAVCRLGCENSIPIQSKSGNAGIVDYCLSEGLRAINQISDAMKMGTLDLMSYPSVSSATLTTVNCSHYLLIFSQAMFMLYNLMGIVGRSQDQGLIAAIGGKIFAWVTSLDDHIFKSSWQRSLIELQLLDLVRLLWDNADNRDYVTKISNLKQQLLSSRSKTTPDVEAFSNWVVEFLEFLKVSFELLHLNTDPSISSSQYDSQLQTILQLNSGSKDLMPMLFNQPRASGGRIHIIALLRHWSQLIASKTIAFAWGHHQMAFSRAWQCYSLLQQSSNMKQIGINSQDPSIICPAIDSQNASVSITRSAGLDTIAIRIEALILLGELYETSGDVSNAVSHFSEAMALAKQWATYSNTLKLIVDLHAIRIWFRCSSSRFLLTINELSGSSQYDQDDARNSTTRTVRKIAKELVNLLGISTDDDDGPGTCNSTVFSYRYLDNYWSVVAIVQCPYDSLDGLPLVTSKPLVYNIPIGINNKLKIDGLREVILANQCKAMNEIKVHEGRMNTKDVLVSTLTQFQEGVHFDVIRDLRRLLCSHIINNNSRQSYPGVSSITQKSNAAEASQAFILGASSCGVSQECIFAKHGISVSSDNSDGATQSPNPTINSMIREATQGNKSAIQSVIKSMQRAIVTISSTTDAPCNIAICFASMDPISDHLVIGRMLCLSTSSNEEIAVISLPVSSTLRELLKQWKDVMRQSEMQLQQTSALSSIEKWTDKDKRHWWKQRADVDAEIESVLHCLEQLLGPWARFISSSSSIETILNAQESNGVAQKEDISVALSKLTLAASESSSSANELPQHHAQQYTQEELAAMKLAELKLIFQSLGLTGATKKADIIAKILSNQPPVAAATCTSSTDSASLGPTIAPIGSKSVQCESSGLDHVILLLDESLQEIPWECMPCLTSVETSRVPSFSLLLQLMESYESSQTASTTSSTDSTSKQTVVDLEEFAASSTALSTTTKSRTKTVKSKEKPSTKSSKTTTRPISDRSSSQDVLINKCWYVVDPESNLPGTQHTMTAFLGPYRDRWNWSGVVGQIPEMETIRCQFATNDVFIYCGHGAGEVMCSSYKLRKMKCPPANFLWGCSSGRLVVQGVHDPHGAALDYLNGGAMNIVANLWDVTDKDIDKLSMECMRGIFDEPNENVAGNGGSGSGGRTTRSLIHSRDCCKLKFAVGSAPVVYGLPIHIRQSL